MSSNKRTKENRQGKVRIGNKRNKKVKRSRRVLKTVVSILLILMITGFSFLAYKIHKNGGGLSGLLATVLGESEESLENLEPIKILIMGISGVDDYKLADTIMVASYDPKTQSASLMSIPRDTYVGKKNRKTATQNYIASYKINTVFRSGENIPEAIERINDITDLDLENYIIIDTNALVKLVDAIGGVTFNIPMDMDYEDSSQDLYIHLKAGEQLVDGQKAEHLLRFRHNDDGSTYPSEYGQQDLGRMRTQREFVTETLKQTLKPQNIFKLKEILDIANEDVTTNMDLSLLKKYVPYAVKFDADNLKTGMLPGDVEMCNGVSIYVADKTKTEELINELFPKDTALEDTSNNTEVSTGNVVSNTEENIIGNTENTTSNKVENITVSEENTRVEIDNSNIRIEVINGTSSNSNLTEVVKALKDNGYTVSKQGTTNIVEKTSIINRTSQSNETITNIKDLIGTASILKGMNSSDVDVTVIIGKDYK